MSRALAPGGTGGKPAAQVTGRCTGHPRWAEQQRVRGTAAVRLLVVPRLALGRLLAAMVLLQRGPQHPGALGPRARGPQLGTGWLLLVGLPLVLAPQPLPAAGESQRLVGWTLLLGPTPLGDWLRLPVTPRVQLVLTRRRLSALRASPRAGGSPVLRSRSAARWHAPRSWVGWQQWRQVLGCFSHSWE